MGYETEALIEVSYGTLLLSVLPLLALVWVSSYLKLGIEKGMIIGTIRALIQLSILGLILEPIFVQGKDMWALVLAYVTFMITLASYEATVRTRYYFQDMFWCVLAILMANVSAVAIFTFGLLLNLHPLWDPQYVIPIIGMLLGNSTDGVALSMNSLLSGVVESSREIELLLSFGATPNEASQRIVREAIRTGSVPRINGLAMIGLISIPGMMTGQILGGSSVTQAARYQILIIYLIAISSFGTIFSETFLGIRMCFDSKQMLRTDWLKKRSEKKSFLAAIWGLLRNCFTFGSNKKSPTAVGSMDEVATLAPVGSLVIKTPQVTITAQAQCTIEVSGLTFAFDKSKNPSEKVVQRRILFEDLKFRLRQGEHALVDGPSGVGKSTLFRLIAGLVPSWEGEVSLCGMKQSSYQDMSVWRKQVLYVPQTKVDIPGSPKSLLKTITEFKVWNTVGIKAPSLTVMSETVQGLIEDWGLDKSLLESEWKELSGGESQRMLLAIAIASKPKVILLDESTSALDMETKFMVEMSIETYCETEGMVAIWITHDQAQQKRLEAGLQEGRRVPNV